MLHHWLSWWPRGHYFMGKNMNANESNFKRDSEKLNCKYAKKFYEYITNLFHVYLLFYIGMMWICDIKYLYV